MMIANNTNMEPKELGKIGVLAGGPSNEREISLKSGEAVFNALREKGADAIFLDIRKELTKDDIKGFGIDVAFIALHGRFGEDGTIQKILECAGLPYTGSRPLASRLALDKIASREIFIKGGIAIPRYEVLRKENFDYADLKKIAQIIKFPLVVKPQFEGSSIGISIARKDEELKEAAALAFNYGDRIIIEEYIKGKELTVGILDDEPLPVIEIVVRERFYNFKAKYNREDTKYIVPAKINTRVYKDAQAKGRLAHRLLGCESFSRVDMLFDERLDKLFVLEVNSIPGLTNHSLLPKAAAAVGIDFGQLCLKIVETALKKRGVSKVGKKQKEIQPSKTY